MAKRIDIRYRHPGETPWRHMSLSEDCFSRHWDDEQFSMELREYLDLKVGIGLSSDEQEALIDALEFPSGGIYQEALRIEKIIKSTEDEEFYQRASRANW